MLVPDAPLVAAVVVWLEVEVPVGPAVPLAPVLDAADVPVAPDGPVTVVVETVPVEVGELAVWLVTVDVVCPLVVPVVPSKLMVLIESGDEVSPHEVNSANEDRQANELRVR